MKSIAAEAKAYISKNRTIARKLTTVEELQSHMDNLRGMVMIAYPGYHGLPEWDLAYLILEKQIDFLAHWPDCEVNFLIFQILEADFLSGLRMESRVLGSVIENLIQIRNCVII